MPRGDKRAAFAGGLARPATQTTYTQTYATATATVPVVATVGAITLITQLDAIIATLLDEITTNRKLINKLIDDLQAAGVSL